MALQLDVEAVAENFPQADEARLGEVGHVMAERAVDRAGGSAGQRDQALRARERLNGRCASSPSLGSSHSDETSRIRFL